MVSIRRSSLFKKTRTRMLQGILLIIVLVNLVITISENRGFALIDSLIAPFTVMLAIATIYLVSQQRFFFIVSLIIVIYEIVIALYTYTFEYQIGLFLLLLCFAAFTAALFLSGVWYWMSNAAVIIAVLWIALTSNQLTNDIMVPGLLHSTLQVITFGTIPVGVGLISHYFVNQLQKLTITTQRTTDLIQISAEIGQTISEMLSLETLLRQTVFTIRDRFNYYESSIFLIQDGDNDHLYLAASTHQDGQQYIERGYRLAANNETLVGKALNARNTLINHLAYEDGSHQSADASLFAVTGSELAIPIMNNRAGIGVLYIQANRPNAFSHEEMTALKLIASQLATGIRNARLFNDKERSIRENQRLFIEAERNLRENQRLNRLLTKQSWQDYLTREQLNGVTLNPNRFSNRAEWSDAMIKASHDRRVVTHVVDGRSVVSVPIMLRDEVIGAIELEGAETFQAEDIANIVSSISDRLAINLDNARLLEESNVITAQEQQISEIVSQYQAADSVDELLQITIQGLAQTLGAEQASIRLGSMARLTPSTTGQTQAEDGI